MNPKMRDCYLTVPNRKIDSFEKVADCFANLDLASSNEWHTTIGAWQLVMSSRSKNSAAEGELDGTDWILSSEHDSQAH